MKQTILYCIGGMIFGIVTALIVSTAVSTLFFVRTINDSRLLSSFTQRLVTVEQPIVEQGEKYVVSNFNLDNEPGGFYRVTNPDLPWFESLTFASIDGDFTLNPGFKAEKITAAPHGVRFNYTKWGDNYTALQNNSINTSNLTVVGKNTNQLWTIPGASQTVVTSNLTIQDNALEYYYVPRSNILNYNTIIRYDQFWSPGSPGIRIKEPFVIRRLVNQDQSYRDERVEIPLEVMQEDFIPYIYNSVINISGTDNVYDLTLEETVIAADLNPLNTNFRLEVDRVYDKPKPVTIYKDNQVFTTLTIKKDLGLNRQVFEQDSFIMLATNPEYIEFIYYNTNFILINKQDPTDLHVVFDTSQSNPILIRYDQK